LQRLCEELEYSDLLDKAAEYDDPFERMVYVAAFAVSSYASTYYREGHKPFNPLLGETYECIREDKGWRFIAEQVEIFYLLILTIKRREKNTHTHCRIFILYFCHNC
jgi:hypothetical protein